MVGGGKERGGVIIQRGRGEAGRDGMGGVRGGVGVQIEWSEEGAEGVGGRRRMGGRRDLALHSNSGYLCQFEIKGEKKI